MELSTTELRAVSALGNGNKTIVDIANALKISRSQTYRILQSLKREGILEEHSKPSKKTHINLLFKLLTRANNLSSPFSGTGLQIFTTLIEPKTAAEVEEETGLHKTTIFKKIRQARKMSLLSIKKNKYLINSSIWPDAKAFLIALREYDTSIDKRVPVTSTIYFKNVEEILFSNKDKLNATLTGFSAYEDFGIKIYTLTHYYYLPKKRLTKREIFIHSLLITEKEMQIQNLIFLSLFYLKYKKEVNNIPHPIIDNLKRVLKGECVKRYPSLQEIEERVKVYDLKV